MNRIYHFSIDESIIICMPFVVLPHRYSIFQVRFFFISFILLWYVTFKTYYIGCKLSKNIWPPICRRMLLTVRIVNKSLLLFHMILPYSGFSDRDCVIITTWLHDGFISNIASPRNACITYLPKYTNNTRIMNDW